jgi:kynureninase
MSFQEVAAETSLAVHSKELADELDSRDELRDFRSQFHFPPTPDTADIRKGEDATIYLCGNSLGLQPKNCEPYIVEELAKWRQYGVEGHFMTERPWMTVHETVRDASARIVGAKPVEVTIMNTLTTNLHLMMVPFYRPTAEKFKILVEAKSFPSDYHAVTSQIKFHGFDPATALVEVGADDGSELTPTEAFVEAIKAHGDSLALVMVAGVQYYTGQAFDLGTIAAAVREHAHCPFGVDLAHAVGNVELHLHDWGVDFAAWCTYKYLNSGPGNIGGCFVHEKHAHDEERPRFAGWWGHRKEDRFVMAHEFHPTPGADGYQLSNPPVITCAALRASLDVFDAATMPAIRAKSVRLTAYLEHLVDTLLEGQVSIITPRDPSQRGAQLSLVFNTNVKAIYKRLIEEGVIVDIREPFAMRVAPAPLYNSFHDVWQFVTLLQKVLREIAAEA